MTVALSVAVNAAITVGRSRYQLIKGDWQLTLVERSAAQEAHLREIHYWVRLFGFAC